MRRILPVVAVSFLLSACPASEPKAPSSEAAGGGTGAGDGTVVFERPDFAKAEVLASPPEGARHVKVEVGRKGYSPNRLQAKAGEVLVLDLVRTADTACGEYVTVYNTPVKKQLPLNETVSLALRMPAEGDVVFSCGMDMMHGMITVQPKGTEGDAPPAEGEPSAKGADSTDQGAAAEP